MINPQITYTDGISPATLAFVYPPTNKPAYMGKAQRADVFSTAGVRQTTTLRTDVQFPMSVAVIQDNGDDLTAWIRFVQWAEAGGAFTYYPDATNLEVGIACFMVESAGTLAYVSPGVYNFAGTFQQEVS